MGTPVSHINGAAGAAGSVTAGSQVLRRLRRNRLAMAGLAIILVFIAMAAFAPWVATHDPLRSSFGQRLQPPSAEHWLGTDELGRDVFSRMVYGARISLRIGFIAVAIGILVGVPLGAVSAYYGGWIDLLVQRIIDVMLAFPGILLALVIIAILGSSLANVMIAIGIATIPTFTRLVRGSTLEVREMEYVDAARAAGAGPLTIMVRHILPNTIQPVIVMATLGVAGAILAAAGLSFIGLGAPPGTPEWGAMLSDARTYMRQAWWMATFPGMAITLTVLAINLLGDALRDVLDPRLRR